MRYALIFSLMALPAFGQEADSPQSGAEAEPPVGGVGRLACRAVIGPENAAYLGQVGDWALGYMAGRLDAGDELEEDATLSPDDTLDVITGIAVRCRETPDQPVIEAVRSFAERVFGAEAQAGPITADAPPPAPDVPEPESSAEPPEQSIVPEPRPGEPSDDAEVEEPADADTDEEAELDEDADDQSQAEEGEGETGE